MQKDTLLEKLKAYADGGAVPFHMPGHKRNGKFGHLMGLERYDVTEIAGFDNLFDAEGVLRDVNLKASEVYGVRASRMLVGGSTAGILAAVRACTADGDKVLIARNCHQSVYNAAEICRLDVSYALPDVLEDGFFGSVSPQEIKRRFDEDGDIKLVVVVSPTYEGVISDIAGIAAECKRRGAILFVDEAHGAHLGFGGFSDSARSLGADIVVNSLHKTLPSLTQTAILHVCSDRVDMARVDEQLAVFQTSSPSYPLMASVEGCIDYLCTDGVRKWRDDVKKLREQLKGLKRIRLYDGEGAYGYDVSKLALILRRGERGAKIMDALRERYAIELEMAGENYCIAMTGAGDTQNMYSRLKSALYELDADEVFWKTALNKADFENTIPKKLKNENTIPKSAGNGNTSSPSCARPDGEGAAPCAVCGTDDSHAACGYKLPIKALPSYEAGIAAYVFVPLESAAGRVVAENIRAYPPGSPIVVKGERLDEETICRLKALMASGVHVQGSRGDISQNIAVLA